MRSVGSLEPRIPAGPKDRHVTKGPLRFTTVRGAIRNAAVSVLISEEKQTYCWKAEKSPARSFLAQLELEF